MTTEQPTHDLSVWVVRAGKKGEDEATALEQNAAIIGWRTVGDLSGCTTREDIAALVLADDPHGSTRPRGHATGQIFSFSVRINVDDIVVLPLKTRRPQVAIGKVIAPYEYREIDGELRHVRPVTWSVKLRNEVSEEFQASLDAKRTVFRVRPHGAYAHFAGLIERVSDKRITPTTTAPTISDSDDPESDDSADQIDIAELALRGIHGHIDRQFPAHEMERLVASVLEAEGYVAEQSPKGADQGVDVLAGRGPMGFDPPRLCVQVKHTGSAIGDGDIQNLSGAFSRFSADHGLFVSWGGYTAAAKREARRQFFTLRLWNANDLIDAICRNYDRLPEDIRAEIPLKQVWTLVEDDDL